MSDQQPKASAAACLSEIAEKGSDSEGGKHTFRDASMQSKTTNNTDELRVSNKGLTQTKSPNKTCTASKSPDQPPITTKKVCYHISYIAIGWPAS